MVMTTSIIIYIMQAIGDGSPLGRDWIRSKGKYAQCSLLHFLFSVDSSLPIL